MDLFKGRLKGIKSVRNNQADADFSTIHGDFTIPIVAIETPV
jgi:hypothetical protein